MATNNPASFRLPIHLPADLHQDVRDALQNHEDAITDLQEAIPYLKSSIDTATSSASTGSTSGGGTEDVTIGTAGVESFNALTGNVVYFPNLGVVNDQSGVTAYTTQISDGGSLVKLNDASAIAVTLNVSTINSNWFTTISNAGTGTATITPQSGTINGNATLTLPGGSWVTIYFDGTNFDADSPGSSAGGVTQITAGTNVTISPSGETGNVTINATGSSGLPVNNPTFTGTITGPHYSSNGATPTIVAGAAAGTSPTILISGTDTAGLIDVTPGTSPSTGVICTVTFAATFSNPPVVLLGSGGSITNLSVFYATSTTTTFSITTSAIPSGGTLSFFYFAIGN